MSSSPESHLSSEQIDAWLGGSPDAATQHHVSQCQLCQEQLRADQEIAELIAGLPLWSPTSGFADRVMASVRVPDPFAFRSLEATRRRMLATPKSMAFAASVGLLLLGSMIASITWTLGHQATIASFGSWVVAQSGQAMWLGVRGIALNIIEQPWYAWVSGFVGNPGRLALFSALVSLAYLGGLLTLRRLLAIPTQRVAHAGF
jgi:hypothetical protein